VEIKGFISSIVTRQVTHKMFLSWMSHAISGIVDIYTIQEEKGYYMGTKGRMIVDMDVDELIRLLNKALSDEWLAYYQYWVGSKIVKGPTKDAVIAELVQHATEELAHADMIALRILQLGGKPVLEPKEWYILTNCGYDVPADPFVRKILEQNIKGERCAIETYNKLMAIVKDKDPITYNMVLTIMSQEVEHEEDLQSLLEDLEVFLK
jgi:bacterioferritin